MKRIVLFLLLAITIVFMITACLKGEREKTRIAGNVKLVLEGDRVRLYSLSGVYGIELTFSGDIPEESFIYSDQFLMIHRNHGESTCVALAKMKEQIMEGENFLTVKHTLSIEKLLLSVYSEDSPEETAREAKLKDLDCSLLGDFNNDCKVNLSDFIVFAQHYNSVSGDSSYGVLYDIHPAQMGTGAWAGIYCKATPDGQIKLGDFIVFANNYGKQCPEENEPPVVTKVSGPSGTIAQSSSTFTWTGDDPDGTITKYEYRKDGGAWTNHALNTNYTWNDYAEGAHTFEVRAQDNEGAYSNTIKWSFTYSTQNIVVGELVLVESGTFMMGDEFGDLWDGCRPVHQVTLTYDFWLGKYEVTFQEYDIFCNDTDRTKPIDCGWGRGTRPVINVSWWDAIAYCNWVSEREGLPVAYRLLGETDEGQMLDANGNVTTDITQIVGYRLPTEAEWEYSARGGNHHSPYKYSGSDNVNEVAWYLDNSGNKTQEVGQKTPNALNIYDMSGNVWEWSTEPPYAGYTSSPKTNPYNIGTAGNAMIRGGSYFEATEAQRVAARHFRLAWSYEFADVGFRVCRTASEKDSSIARQKFLGGSAY